MISLPNMRSVFARFDAPVPPAAPDDGESTGDLSPDDDTDCAVEGVAQPVVPQQTMPKETDDVTTWRVAMVLRVRLLKDRVRHLELALNTANNHLQSDRFRIAELEKTVRALTAVQETAA